MIWTKFDLESDPITDDLTPKARAEIDNFVDKTFRREVPPENVSYSEEASQSEFEFGY